VFNKLTFRFDIEAKSTNNLIESENQTNQEVLENPIKTKFYGSIKLSDMIERDTHRQMPLLPTPIEYTSSTRNKLPPLLDFPIGNFEVDLSHQNTSRNKNDNDSVNYSTGTSNSRSSTLSSHDFSKSFYQKYRNNNSFNCQFHKSSGNNNTAPIFQKSLSCGSATTNSSSGCESITTPVSFHTISPPQFTNPEFHDNNFNNYCSVPSNKNVTQKKSRERHRGIPNFIKTATLVTNEEQAKKVEISRKAEIEKSLIRKSKKKTDKLEEKSSVKSEKQHIRKTDDSVPTNFNDKSDVAFAGNVACPDASTLPTPPREWVDAKQKSSNHKKDPRSRSQSTNSGYASSDAKFHNLLPASVIELKNHLSMKLPIDNQQNKLQLLTRDNRHKFPVMPDFGEEQKEETEEQSETVKQFFAAFSKN
jgi:hypothetical protein